MNEKFCPLLSISEQDMVPCKAERCGWWRVDNCALVEIARNSADIQAVSDSIDGRSAANDL